MWTKDRIQNCMFNSATPSMFAWSFTSDESPPSENRYTGLRFQITYFHWLRFYATSCWEQQRFDNKYPFVRERHLGDIVNCPGKTGSDVLVYWHFEIA
eukprot:8098218-Karenia_brevis.AAC.1